MVHYCCAYNCYNVSTNSDFSFRKYPKELKLQKLNIHAIFLHLLVTNSRFKFA